MSGIDIFKKMIEELPRSPGLDAVRWTNGDFVLCSENDDAERLADYLEYSSYSIGENLTVMTGYYDPEEDRKSGEVDECTGYWYVCLD